MKLPSGRELELRPLTYGDIRDAEDAQLASGLRGLAIFWDRLMCAVSGLTLQEIRGLTPQDGQALFAATRNVQEGRPPEAEAPFVTSSSSPSEDSQG